MTDGKQDGYNKGGIKMTRGQKTPDDNILSEPASDMIRDMWNAARAFVGRPGFKSAETDPDKRSVCSATAGLRRGQQSHRDAAYRNLQQPTNLAH